MANKGNKDEDQEKTYEVKDKRRVNPDGSLREEVESQESKVESPEGEAAQHPEPVEGAEPAEAPPEEEQAEPAGPSAEEEVPAPEAEAGPGEELPLPDIYQTLQFVAGLLAEQAWQFMGLRLPPGRKNRFGTWLRRSSRSTRLSSSPTSSTRTSTRNLARPSECS